MIELKYKFVFISLKPLEPVIRRPDTISIEFGRRLERSKRVDSYVHGNYDLVSK